jgi:wyosine [tRNA(Phe)-imidazoG37] synthetase (radical SAM superfamily)
MSGIPLQAGIIYGPILSRRLGRSLGINLLGVNQKVCSFDCIYCQYGRANVVDQTSFDAGFPSMDDVLRQVERSLKKPRTIDFLTFSGNGEPTLHPNFPEIVQGVMSLRNRLRPDAKLAILSNSSRVNNADVLSSLHLFDAPMMKLDAGDENTFQLINRPAKSVRFSEIITGLKSLPNLMIQSLLIDGKVSNVRGEAYEAWVRVLAELNPRIIHIYSIDRPTAYDAVDGVTLSRLNAIAEDLRNRYDLAVSAF